MMTTPVAMLLRRPRASPMMDVVMAPRKQPTGRESLSGRYTFMGQVDVEPTIVYRHNCPNQSLTGFVKGVIEGIAVH